MIVIDMINLFLTTKNAKGFAKCTKNNLIMNSLLD